MCECVYVCVHVCVRTLSKSEMHAAVASILVFLGQRKRVNIFAYTCLNL